jgi:predicted kinase
MIILGTPASGKTTLARRLAAELRVPCLCKDDVKEALFEILGVCDRDGSRRYSDASFAAQLRLAKTQLQAGLSCLLEANWRGEHAPAVLGIAGSTGARLAQILCRCEPGERVRRFTSRVRHPGHLDASVDPAEHARAAEQAAPFLELPGPRWVYDSDSGAAYGTLLARLNSWRL